MSKAGTVLSMPIKLIRFEDTDTIERDIGIPVYL
jgi:hypothetical protein